MQRSQIRLNKHSKDKKNPHSIRACKHFNNWNHVFHKHGKFIPIEKLNNSKNTSTEVLKQRLKERKNFWIKRPKPVAAFCLNQVLTKSMACSTSFYVPPFLPPAYGSNI